MNRVALNGQEVPGMKALILFQMIIKKIWYNFQ